MEYTSKFWDLTSVMPSIFSVLILFLAQVAPVFTQTFPYNLTAPEISCDRPFSGAPTFRECQLAAVEIAWNFRPQRTWRLTHSKFIRFPDQIKCPYTILNERCNLTMDYETDTTLSPPAQTGELSDWGRRLAKACAMPSGGGGTLRLSGTQWGDPFTIVLTVGANGVPLNSL